MKQRLSADHDFFSVLTYYVDTTSVEGSLSLRREENIKSQVVKNLFSVLKYSVRLTCLLWQVTPLYLSVSLVRPVFWKCLQQGITDRLCKVTTE